MRIGSVAAGNVEVLQQSGAQLLWSGRRFETAPHSWRYVAYGSPAEFATVEGTLEFALDPLPSETVPGSGTLWIGIVLEGAVLQVLTIAHGIQDAPVTFAWEARLRVPDASSAAWTLDVPHGRPISGQRSTSTQGHRSRRRRHRRGGHSALPREILPRGLAWLASLDALQAGDRFDLAGPDRAVTVRLGEGYPQARVRYSRGEPTLSITPQLGPASEPALGSPAPVVFATWEMTARV
jgi:hypothetical protein